MVPLQANRFVLTWLCVYPADSRTSKWMQRAQKSFCIFNFVFLSMLICTSLVHLSKCLNEHDSEEIVFMILQINGILSSTNLMVTIFILRDKITKMMNCLNKMYKRYWNEDMFRFLQHANIESGKLWTFYFKHLMYGGTISNIPLVAFCVLNSYRLEGHIDGKYLYHMFHHSVPWNPNTLFGYLAAVLYDLIGGMAFAFAHSIFVIQFIMSYFHHQTFYKMFQRFTQKIDQSNDNRNRKKIVRKLIRFHILAEDFFDESSGVFCPLILATLFSAMFLLACAIFHLDLRLKHPDFSIAILGCAAQSSISILFLFCYFGRLSTEQYEKMPDCLYESKWNEIPIELQKLYVIIIGVAQRPLFYHGYGIVYLNLQTFTRMMKSVYTCYMMFKTVTA